MGSSAYGHPPRGSLAEDSPAVLVEYARAWLDSEESERFR